MKQKIDYPALAVFEVTEGMKKHYSFNNGERFLLLGEISNMPGHVVLVDNTNKIFWGYHLSDFRVLTQEET